ncbi:hypothetical protein N658DRAFT_526474 [Parathielavia hyrcaniae]|uniref:Uncharacterized protein n=1 Tax=Parathielavia hyrcaniae TaxID=113614 RepID=A0AAN6PUM6_9PEZI|nr:hypothetical protein N658DRAFT_526474 [Parathielavia hyrcaniae]
MARKSLIFPSFLHIFLVLSRYTWAGNVAADGAVPAMAIAREVVGGEGGAEPSWRGIAGRVEGRCEGSCSGFPLAADREPAAHAVRDGCRATITPPPILLNRQDGQGQIQALSDQLRQLSEQSRSVSQASQQVSQSSQQLSQSLQQATQRLSQSEQQLASARLQQGSAESASRSMSEASAEASRRADEARASADGAISEAVRSASQSASRALSENLASLTSSLGASFSSALLLASQSAASAASAARRVQADATALSDNASEQMQQAQGAALSVTQTAIAVIGGVIGSSLLTGVGFVLVLRHRRRKKRRRDEGIAGSTGYPPLSGTSNMAYSIPHSKKDYATSDDRSSTYSTDDVGFQFLPGSNIGTLQQPAPVIPRKGIASSGSGGGGGNNSSQRIHRAFPLGDQPALSGTAAAGAVTTSAAARKLALFRPRDGASKGLRQEEYGYAEEEEQKKEQRQQQRRPQQQATPGAAASAALSSSAGGAGVGDPVGGRDRGGANANTQPEGDVQLGVHEQGNMSGAGLPSLDRWLREGTNVSPFSTLLKGARASQYRTRGGGGR